MVALILYKDISIR